MTRYMKIKILSVLIVIIALSVFLPSCKTATEIDLTNSKPEGMGNTMGNLQNAGIVTNDENSIYYITTKDSQAILNRKSINGEQQVLLELDNRLCFFLNAVSDFIYYTDSTDGTIYKIDTKGMQNEKLCNIKASFLLVANGTVYALGGETDSNTGNLYAMNVDGSDIKVLSNDKIWKIFLYDNQIYYATVGEFNLYKMDMNGDNKEFISQNIGIMNWFYIYNDRIYYETQGGGFAITIREFDLNSKKDTLVYEDEIKGRMIPNGCINAADNIIYFQATGAPLAYICLNLDTAEVKTSSIQGSKILGLYTIGNKIFYYVKEQPYTMNFDGSEQRRFN